ncbi:MAG: hypothetical protein ACE5G1_02175 [bacterium]
MKKIISVSLVFLLTMGLLTSIGAESKDKDKKSDEPIVIKLINPDFGHGRLYLTDTFSTPYYLGRINPGHITYIKFPTPFPSRKYTLVVTSGGRVTHAAKLEYELEAGDRIEWDLAYNLFSWQPKER